MSNPIQSFTDSEGTNWHYFDGSFWASTTFNSKICLIACAAMQNGSPDILSDGSVNACDVECCKQSHLDFVNNVFSTNFKLREVCLTGEGEPTYG